MKAYAALMAVGGALIALVGWLWGRGAAVGGAVALAAQLWAVVLLRPAMRAPMPRFMGRWLGGMAVRALAMAGVLVTAVARPDVLPLLAAALGFLAVLLPLLFLETRFLR